MIKMLISDTLTIVAYDKLIKTFAFIFNFFTTIQDKAVSRET